MNTHESHLNIINKLGLHARAAAKLSHLAAQFKSDIQISKPGIPIANAKNIIALMMLAASCDSQLHIRAQGEDAKEAIEAIEVLVNNRFDEAE